MHIAEILEVRWMGPGVSQRIKTYAWNCVTYLLVVCILFLFFPYYCPESYDFEFSLFLQVQFT